MNELGKKRQSKAVRMAIANIRCYMLCTPLKEQRKQLILEASDKYAEISRQEGHQQGYYHGKADALQNLEPMQCLVLFKEAVKRRCRQFFRNILKRRCKQCRKQ